MAHQSQFKLEAYYQILGGNSLVVYASPVSSPGSVAATSSIADADVPSLQLDPSRLPQPQLKSLKKYGNCEPCTSNYLTKISYIAAPLTFIVQILMAVASENMEPLIHVPRCVELGIPCEYLPKCVQTGSTIYLR